MMSVKIDRPIQIALLFICAASLYPIGSERAIAQPNDRQYGKFGDYACEAYAWGYAVAQTKRHYVEICGAKGGKLLSFYAFDRQSADPEKTKVQIDNVSRNDRTFTARLGGNRYTLTRDYLTLVRNGKVIFQEKVTNYRKLS